MKVVREHLNEEIPDSYYQNKLGVLNKSSSAVSDDDPVTRVFHWDNKASTPIVMNPTDLDFDDTRAIIDENGNLYVSVEDGDFNHGLMSNALCKKQLIHCKAMYDLNTAKGGAYEEPERFIMGHMSGEIFYGADTLQVTPTTLSIIAKAERKNPDVDFEDIKDAVEEENDDFVYTD